MVEVGSEYAKILDNKTSGLGIDETSAKIFMLFEEIEKILRSSTSFLMYISIIRNT